MNLFRHKKEPMTLSEVQDVLMEIPSLNKGGCAISALAMYRWLKKYNLHNGTQFVYCHGEEDANYTTNKNALTNNTDGASCAHVVLYLGGVFIDSTGYVSVGSYMTLSTNDENFVVRSINNPAAHWNKEFNRKYVKTISKLIGIDLSDIKK